MAGVSHYVEKPFVSFGFAKPEPNNKYNSKAIAIYTDKEIKVGYIAEKELSKFYSENEGTIPIVMEAHYYNGKLYGNLYTFTNNEHEYHYMRNQYIWLIHRLT